MRARGETPRQPERQPSGGSTRLSGACCAETGTGNRTDRAAPQAAAREKWHVGERAGKWNFDRIHLYTGWDAPGKWKSLNKFRAWCFLVRWKASHICATRFVRNPPPGKLSQQRSAKGVTAQPDLAKPLPPPGVQSQSPPTHVPPKTSARHYPCSPFSTHLPQVRFTLTGRQPAWKFCMQPPRAATKIRINVLRSHFPPDNRNNQNAQQRCPAVSAAMIRPTRSSCKGPLSLGSAARSAATRPLSNIYNRQISIMHHSFFPPKLIFFMSCEHDTLLKIRTRRGPCRLWHRNTGMKSLAEKVNENRLLYSPR